MADATSTTAPPELQALQARVAELEAQLAAARQAEARLRHYADLADRLHIGLHLYHLEDLDDDSTLRMVAVNAAAEAMTGLRAVDVVGRTLDENFPGLRERGVPQAYAQVIRTGQDMTLEDLHYGDARVLQTAFAVRAFALPEQHLAVTFEVITERKRAEQETARLVAILETTPDMIGTADLDGHVCYINRSGRQQLGIAEDASLEGLRIVDTQPEWAARVILEEALPQAAREGYWSGETAMLGADGEEIPVSQVVIAHKNALGDVEFVSSIMRDQRQRQAIEAALRENEQRLTQFLDALPVGVFVVEPSGQPYFANQLAATILGRGIAPGVAGDQLAEVYQAYLAGTDQPYPAAQMPLIRSLGGERATISDMEIQQPGGRVLLEVHGAPIRNATGEVIYGLATFTDITLRKQAEQALREHAVQQELIAAQQGALRELSTPLMPISEGVVVMPIVGTIDSARAQLIMESLLEGIGEHTASVAIIDITGVRVVDTQVAGALIRAAQAARLLGAEVILSGISPEIAQTLIHIGVDLRELVAKSSLQQGIAYALERRG